MARSSWLGGRISRAMFTHDIHPNARVFQCFFPHHTATCCTSLLTGQLFHLWLDCHGHLSDLSISCTLHIILQFLKIKSKINTSRRLLLLHPFNGLFSRTTWVGWHQKGKPFWILLEQEMMGWQWHQLENMQIICTSLQTDNYVSTSPLCFTRMPFLPPNQQRQSTEGICQEDCIK